MTTNPGQPSSKGIELIRPSRPEPRGAVTALTPSVRRYPFTADAAGPDDVLLHLNEVPNPPSPKVIDAIRRHAADLNRYPAAQSADLRAAIASRAGMDAEHVVLGNGSDELIQAVATAYVEPGDEVIFPVPSFPKYKQSSVMMLATAIEVMLSDDGCVNVGALMGRVSSKTALVFVPTPNNPTGGLVSTEALRFIIAQVPRTSLLVFDEAYHEFATEAGGPDLLLHLVPSDRDWIILRTFSKAQGLAGLRLGYALTSGTVIAEALRRVLPVFNVSSLACAAGLAALEDEAYTRATVRAITDRRNDVKHQLVARGFRVLPSATNFLAVDIGRPSAKIVTALRERGVFVASIPGTAYDTFVRVTVTSADEMDRFLATLDAVVAADTPTT